MDRAGGELMRAAILASLCLVGVAQVAHAQERLRISINAADQVTSRTLNQNFTVPINVEDAPISTSIEIANAPMFDIGASYRFLNRLAAGLSVSTLSRDVDGTLNAKIPHPFYFTMPRAIDGTIPGMHHQEIGVHVYAMYFIPLTGKLDLGVFGGPSHFSVKQDFATDVDYTASYPFDTATFTGAPLERISASVTGYNVGVDISWRVAHMLAVGGLIRFTGASTTFTVASGNQVNADLGGLQTGVGVRIIF
jgi:hypothetical protein